MKSITIHLTCMSAFTLLCAAPTAFAQEPSDGEREARPPRAEEKRGLRRNDPGALPGFTLFAPLRSISTYLIDMNGKVVHEWKSDAAPGNAVRLLANGNLLRTARVDDNPTFMGGGQGGRLVEIDWDGKVVWDYRHSSESTLQHHDAEPLPNGNVLLIAWEKKSKEEALAAGRDADSFRGEQFWPDAIFEVEPVRPSGGKIVWEWHAWDHLVQDRDASKPNFGKPAEHPELIDLHADIKMGMKPETSEEMGRLRKLGYAGGEDEEDGALPPRRGGPGGSRGGPGGMGKGHDWMHTNSVCYLADRDQILVSVHNFGEFWILDHSTTSAEARGHSGGKTGHGGDLLYRWGNPAAYGAGTAQDQRLFGQHDARLIASGLPGAGHVLVFNNGLGGDRARSSVLEVEIPSYASGAYAREGKAFGPADTAWKYASAEISSSRLSSAQRLANGNTFVCAGESGRFLEVKPDGTVVWEYANPFNDPKVSMGPGPRGPGGRRGPRGAEGGPGPDGGPPPGDANGGEPRESRPPREAGGEGPQGSGPGGGGPRMGPDGGPGGRNANGVFHALRIPLDHPGLTKLRALPTTESGTTPR